MIDIQTKVREGWREIGLNEKRKKQPLEWELEWKTGRIGGSVERNRNPKSLYSLTYTKVTGEDAKREKRWKNSLTQTHFTRTYTL